MKNVVYVSSFGAFLSKKGDRLIIKLGDGKVEYSLRDVGEVVILGLGKSISVDLVRELVENRVPLIFSYANGWPYAFILPITVSGTVARRRAQYLAYNSPRGVELAKKFIYGKLYNQASLLKLWSKSRKDSPEVFQALRRSAREIEALSQKILEIRSDSLGEARLSIMNLEGRAADIYWRAFKLVLPEKIDFPGREKRGAKDFVNSLLNLGYSILFKKVFIAVAYAGLDPYAGFLHSDRSGRASLVLDIMEEFRQQVVDRVVVRMLNKKSLRPEDSVDDEGKLKDWVVKEAINEFENRYSEKVSDIYGRKMSIESFIRFQAMEIGRYLLGEIDEYKPFALSW